MARPAVDVVVPFRGNRAALAQLLGRLTSLRLEAQDTVVVVDNTPGGASDLEGGGRIRVHRAAERATPGYARNRGVALGSAQWLVFIDADTVPAPDLLDRYFEPPPASGTVLLAGEILDQDLGANAPAVARYAYLRGALSQSRSLGRGFAQTANLACRRSAFEAVGGFREDIRAAEDADLTFRLRAARGELERRPAASVVHVSRSRLGLLVVQALRHGAGAGWLDREYPGSFPGHRSRLGLAWWAARTWGRAAIAIAGRRERDELLQLLLDPVWELSFELGRSLPNGRPRSRGRGR